MIALTDMYNRQVLIHPDQIASVTEAGASQAWHGIRSNVQKAVDGRWIEVKESADDIRSLLDAAREA